VTFDSFNAGVNAMPSSVTVTPGNYLPAMPADPSKTGYTFSGWHLGQYGTGGQFTGATIINSNMTVSARWTTDPTQNIRYLNPIYSVNVSANVAFAAVQALVDPFTDESITTPETLYMDIYTPIGDANTSRPVIIFAHSGGFYTGTRNNDDMEAFCSEFAARGYVAVTIDYRLGFAGTISGIARAFYRGLQDGRSAVRFLRANASTYGIDASKVYFAGSSAGAFIALHSIYMTTPAEKPTQAGTTPDLGGFDIGDNLTYNGTPDAVTAMWGAVDSTDLIEAQDTKPVLLIHGTADTTVPFNIGHPFGIPLFPATYGSGSINAKLVSMGFTRKMTLFVNGADHEFYGVETGMWTNGIGGNDYWQPVVNTVADFFYAVENGGM